jgi:predicted nucleic acid-binding protein
MEPTSIPEQPPCQIFRALTTRALHVAEPPAPFRLRPPLVVDCSVLAAAVFQEEGRDLAQQRLSAHDLHAPWLLQSEIANVAVKKMKQGFEAEARAGLERVQELSASYLWLAADLRVPLVTFDERLANAARAHLAGLA